MGHSRRTGRCWSSVDFRSSPKPDVRLRTWSAQRCALEGTLEMLHPAGSPVSGTRVRSSAQLRIAVLLQTAPCIISAAAYGCGMITILFFPPSSPCSRSVFVAAPTFNLNSCRLTHLDHRDQCCILFKSNEGSAQVVWLWQGGAPSICCRNDGAILVARPSVHTRRGAGRLLGSLIAKS